MFLQVDHVEIVVGFEPVLVDLDRQRPHQARQLRPSGNTRAMCVRRLIPLFTLSSMLGGRPEPRLWSGRREQC